MKDRGNNNKEGDKFYKFEKFKENDEVIINLSHISPQVGIIKYFRKTPDGVLFFIQRDNYKGTVGIEYNKETIILSKHKRQ